MRIFRLLFSVALITALGIVGADLARAQHPAATSEKPFWSFMFTPLHTSLNYGLNPLAEPLNIVVIGTDTIYDGAGRVLPGVSGHSDAMMFVRIQPVTHRIDVLSIPRDTLVTIPGHSPNKMSVVNFLGGTSLVKRTVEGLLSMPVQHTVRLNMEGVSRLIDTIGGVDVLVERPLNYDDNTARLHIHFARGRYHLDGKRAMEYLRFRHDALGDIGRVHRQQAFLRSLLTQTLKKMTLWQLPSIVKAIQDNTQTDISASMIWQLGAWYCLDTRKSLHFAVVPGKFDFYARSSIWRADRGALTTLLQQAQAFNVSPPASLLLRHG